MSNSQSNEIVIAGAGGRMGRTIIELLPEFDEFQLAGALEDSDSELIDEPVSDVAELPERSSVKVSDDPEAVLNENQILIDFTRPEATRTFLKLTRNRGTKMVIGTTGLTEDDHQLIDNSSENTAIVQAPNMSVGVNLLRNLVRKTTDTLDEGFDVEILEMHHRHKEDAPSGTANMLAEEVASTRGENLDDVKTTGREGFVGERDSDEIGILSM